MPKLTKASPRREKYVPKHRDVAPPLLPPEAARKVVSTTVVLGGVAAATTAVGVGGGVAASGPATSSLVTAAQPASASLASAGSAAGSALEERTAALSRSDRRRAADPAKEAALAADAPAITRSEDLADADPRSIGRALLGEFGFSSDQFGCLDNLWTKESNWTVTADNPTSSAYGIPQALPGEKMATAGADWATNPVTQIRWGLGYIQDRYGSPCAAWAHSVANNWY